MQLNLLTLEEPTTPAPATAPAATAPKAQQVTAEPAPAPAKKTTKRKPRKAGKKKASKGPSPKAAAAIQSVIDRFEAGDLSPIVEIARMEVPKDVPSSQWTFANRVMAFSTTGLNIDCRGFQQWREAGREVKKGSSAGYIFGPRVVKDADNLDPKGEPTTKVIGFFSIPVFGVDATEGDPLPYDQELKPKTLPPLYEVAARLGVSVKYTLAHPAANGMYIPGKKEIQLYTHDDRTFFHELAHAAHDKIDPDFKMRSEGQVEAVAEFTACVLASMYDYDITGKSFSYIQGHYKDPVKAIMKLLSLIEKTIALIEDKAQEE